MRTVTSPDGTPIAIRTEGQGPHLVLVHGVGTDRELSWRHVLPTLARRRTVHAYDRRGRGRSGDRPEYAFGREVEDALAVLRAAEAPVDLLGHSFGGVVALEAALASSRVRRLVLYESIDVRGPDRYRPGLVDELESMVGAGEVDDVLVTMMREVVGRSDEEIECLRADRDAWSARRRCAATIPRELRADAAYVFDPERFADLSVPVLLLVGGASPPREHEAAAVVAAALPDAHVATLEHQAHIAMITAPDAFAEAVLDSLDA